MSTKKKGSSFGGYVGEYNGNILKSAYEYVFAKILENDGVDYKVEEMTFKLEKLNVRYTPDFFLYNSKGELFEIVEIRGHRFGIEERIESVSELRKIVDDNIVISLYTELDIRDMCKLRGMSYNQLKMEWRNSPNTIRGSSQGKANPMYGVKMTDETKALISERGKERARKDPEKYRKLGENLAQWGRERDFYFTRGERVPRHTLTCQRCGKTFTVTQGKKDKRKYCSTECGSLTNAEYATEVTMANKKARDAEMKEFILKWSEENKEVVLNAKYNNIEPSLSDLLDKLKLEFNVIDFRTIASSFGLTSRKKLLTELKNYVSKL